MVNNSSYINLKNDNDVNMYEQINRNIYYENIDNRYNSNNISYNNSTSSLLNYKIKHINYSEKLENKYKTKIKIFEERKEKENNDINKENQKEEGDFNINANSMEKEPNLEENNISSEFMNKYEKEEIIDI